HQLDSGILRAHSGIFRTATRFSLLGGHLDRRSLDLPVSVVDSGRRRRVLVQVGQGAALALVLGGIERTQVVKGEALGWRQNSFCDRAIIRRCHRVLKALSGYALPSRWEIRTGSRDAA